MLNRFSSSRADLHKRAVPKEDELSDNCDVAVVGYGPTGMTVAALLGRLGHRVIVLERYTGLYNLPRAACFDDEIMRVFQKLGIAEEIGRGARPQYEYDWVNAAGETLVKLEYDKTASGGWAALFMMFQPHIEAVLDSYDKALPTVEVRQGVTVSNLMQIRVCDAAWRWPRRPAGHCPSALRNRSRWWQWLYAKKALPAH